jgi:hypothetical protein
MYKTYKLAPEQRREESDQLLTGLFFQFVREDVGILVLR